MEASHSKNGSSKGFPTIDVTCIKGLLKHEPDHVYRFQPDDLNANAPERPSFEELADQWKHAPEDRRNDHGSFPEIRGRRARRRFTQCTLRCMCHSCEEGDPVDIVCRPHPFVHTGKGEDMVQAFSMVILSVGH